jgi:hypothetical protein
LRMKSSSTCESSASAVMNMFRKTTWLFSCPNPKTLHSLFPALRGRDLHNPAVQANITGGFSGVFNPLSEMRDHGS